MNTHKILYRGVSSKSKIHQAEYVNLSNDQGFAAEYGDIVLVYEFLGTKIEEEKIEERMIDVTKYDALMNLYNFDAYRWNISKENIYHYRAKLTSLKLIKIIYLGENNKINIGALTRYNRKILGYNQSTFSQKLGIPRVKISEYENAVREPSLEKILLLSSLLDIPQELHMGGRKILLQK